MIQNLPEEQTEAKLIQRIVAGDQSLYELIVRRYNPTLYKVGRGYGYSHEDTQDLMQDTFVDAYKGLKQFENRSAFKTWLVRIMLNNCYRKTRRSSYANELAKPINENAQPMFSNRQSNPARTMNNQELKNIIESSLSSLPVNYRMVFTLREINGLSTAEAAHLLEITEANVKVRLSRAKAMLRSELENNYSPEELFDFNLIYCDVIVQRVMEQIKDL